MQNDGHFYFIDYAKAFGNVQHSNTIKSIRETKYILKKTYAWRKPPAYCYKSE